MAGAPQASGDEAVLQHVLLVGGTLAQWQGLDEGQWAQRLSALGTAADHAGARWLTLRPLDATAAARADSPGALRRQLVGGCVVTANPQADGRTSFVAAVEALRQSGTSITEAAIDRVLDDPAEANPDLAVVLGPAERWPRALMWELAYSELVYLDAAWDHLQPDHLAEAIAAYARRHRRFGGVD